VNIATQFVKYVTVAVLSAASDWAVFATLFAAFGWTIQAQAISRIVGGLVSFGTNKYWSFQSYEHKQVLHEAWRPLKNSIFEYTNPELVEPSKRLKCGVAIAVASALSIASRDGADARSRY